MTHANTLISIFCSRILGYHSSPQLSTSNSLIQSSNLNFSLAKPASLYYLNLLHISSSFSMRTSLLTLHDLPPSTQNVPAVCHRLPEGALDGQVPSLQAN